MNDDRVKELLRAAIPRPGDAELKRDLWPDMRRRLDERRLRVSAFDWVLIAAILASMMLFPQAALAPALDAAVQRLGGVPLLPLMARALTMGDELHQRNVAATGLFFRAIAPALVEGGAAGSALPSVLRFLADNDQFFLNLAMAGAKAMAGAIREIPYSTVVTVMSRNGVEFGIRVSGLGDQWFTAPAPALLGESQSFTGR